MNIIWKDVIGYEDLYSVSNTGLVKGKKYNRLLKPHVYHGYYKVSLCKQGVETKVAVHRLVAKHFVNNPDSKPQVNHINGDKLTNTAVNLEWVTCSENHLHAYATGLKDSTKCCPKIGNNKGITSQYMYVSYFKNAREEKYQATITAKGMTRSRSFSVKKYGKDAELLAAKAANDLIDNYSQFQNRPKNIV